ncbi:DMT family transporter [Paenibacillus sp. JCM 10914]|uniref:DMT family transporter n=1 Tax=Paenibacillus sp. JCM 10914 TaxID=1236974 RepID=UPI0003CC8823|nr:DMT family transporter [Paenibacillus sp. JCM 10914]GAE06339.1 glycerol-3-phosphate dehydrogenase [Paenibacillus sp. JCM 10914]
MNTPRKGRAYAAVLLYTLIIGFSFMFAKMAITIADPLDTLAHRFTISLAAASAALLMTRRRFRWRKKEMLAVIPLAVFYPLLFFILQTLGLVYTTSAEAGIINATVPIFTMLLASLFLKEHSNALQKSFTAISVAGVILIFVLKGVSLASSSTLGIILILLSALSTSVYTVMARRLTQKQSVLDITFMMSLLGFVTFNVISVSRHAAVGNVSQYFAAFSHPTFVWSVLYLGVLASLGTSLLANYTLSQLEASRMSIFNNLSTIITIFAGVLFLQEQIAYYHILGAVLVITGVIGVSLAGHHKSRSAVIRSIQKN